MNPKEMQSPLLSRYMPLTLAQRLQASNPLLIRALRRQILLF